MWKIERNSQGQDYANTNPPNLHLHDFILLLVLLKTQLEAVLTALSKNFCLLHLKYHKYRYTDKKEKKIFLIYKEIQSGAVEKPYMRKGFLIYEEMRKYFTIYV
jgi:hypothetical protein